MVCDITCCIAFYFSQGTKITSSIDLFHSWVGGLGNNLWEMCASALLWWIYPQVIVELLSFNNERSQFNFTVFHHGFFFFLEACWLQSNNTILARLKLYFLLSNKRRGNWIGALKATYAYYEASKSLRWTRSSAQPLYLSLSFVLPNGKLKQWTQHSIILPVSKTS